MSLKKINNLSSEPTKEKEESKSEVSQEATNTPDYNTVLGADTDNFVQLADDDDKGAAFPDPPGFDDNVVDSRIETQPNAMSVHPPEFYEKQQGGFAPAIEVNEANKKHENVNRNVAKTKVAKPATEIDLEHLDESMIMDMPEIQATSFKIIDMLDPKPKDKAVRFRWANYKNFTAGNLGKYLAIGFQVASIDDVDQTKTPIDPSMIDGTQIKYYDILLLKINVIRLMELYKTNIVKSINKLVKVKEKGLAEANRQFQNDISANPGMAAKFNQYKHVLGHDPVEFFASE